MTDVVDIARKRRSSLAKEMAKLDEFISMADMLLKLENARSDNAGASGELAQPPAAKAPSKRPDGSTPDDMDEAEADVDAPATGGRSLASGEDVSPGGAGRDQDVADPQPKDESSEEELHHDSWTDITVGQKIRQRRWMMSISKSALAERIGVPAAEIQNFELGLTHLDMSQLEKLAKVLDVSVSYFIDEEKRSFSDVGDGSDAHRPGAKDQPPATADLARTA